MIPSWLHSLKCFDCLSALHVQPFLAFLVICTHPGQISSLLFVSIIHHKKCTSRKPSFVAFSLLRLLDPFNWSHHTIVSISAQLLHLITPTLQRQLSPADTRSQISSNSTVQSRLHCPKKTNCAHYTTICRCSWLCTPGIKPGCHQSFLS